MNNYNFRRLNMLYNNLATVMAEAATIQNAIRRVKNDMQPHEREVLEERLSNNIKSFNAKHDTPRSDARPLHDKYTAVFDIKELAQRNQ